MQNTILQTLKVYEKMGYNTQFISVEDHIGEVFTQWGEGLVVLSGQSGVGKSTLLNKYYPELDIEKQHIYKAINREKQNKRKEEILHDMWIDLNEKMAL